MYLQFYLTKIPDNKCFRAGTISIKMFFISFYYFFFRWKLAIESGFFLIFNRLGEPSRYFSSSNLRGRFNRTIWRVNRIDNGWQVARSPVLDSSFVINELSMLISNLTKWKFLRRKTKSPLSAFQVFVWYNKLKS